MARIQQQENNDPEPEVRVGVTKIVSPGSLDWIVVPNSLWTAGCCVRPNGYVQSFAVIGNNVYGNTLTQQVTTAWLQGFLSDEVTYRHIGGPVDLFPGNAACLNNDVKLPEVPPIPQAQGY